MIETRALNLEELLKCEICDSTLHQTRLVSDCGHRFCLECITEKIKDNSVCPDCHLPAYAEQLRESPMYESLVQYVGNLKNALLGYTLTPLEESLMKQTEFGTKRVLDTQTTDDNLEDEYNDIPEKKKFKGEDSSDSEQGDHMHLLDDILDMSTRPVRKTAAKSPNYTAGTVLTESDDDLEELPIAPPENTVIDSPRTPEETATTNKIWKCAECEAENKTYLQTCGVCHKYRNRDKPAATITRAATSERDAKEPASTIGGSRSLRRTSSSVDAQSLEGATLAASRRGGKSTTAAALPKKETVHIMYTGFCKEDLEPMENRMKKIAEHKLNITLHEELRYIDDVTHVISSVDSKKRAPRTLKYLHALLLGKWIVESAWLTDSMKAKRWLPEKDYEVKGDAKMKMTYAPSKGRERVENNSDKFFQGMRFFLHGDFSDAHSKQNLGLLISAAGGRLLTKRPAALDHSLDDNELDPSEPIVIYATKKDKPRPAWLSKCQVRDDNWVVNSISKLEIL